jgi:hypothetical protein
MAETAPAAFSVRVAKADIQRGWRKISTWTVAEISATGGFPRWKFRILVLIARKEVQLQVMSDQFPG